MNRSLLILQDSLDFGGHEGMFLRFLPTLIASDAYDRILMRYPASNRRLAERLDAHASDRFRPQGWDHAKRWAEPYLAPFRRDYARAFRSLLATERPSALLLLQGRIENCAVPMLATPRDHLLISYVPMAHGMADIGRVRVPGDLVRRRLYRRPQRFIVPGRAVADQIAAAGGRAPVVVVDNVVDPPPRPDRTAARNTLGLDSSARVALFLGRLDVRQKGIDMLVDRIRRQADRVCGWTFLFVGSGEGAPICERLCRDMAGRLDIRCIPWTERPHEVLAAADLMLMPSRWEGVPLVMLEAMQYGLPVLGSDIDVFRDYLPADNRIDFASADLANAMHRAAGPEHADAYRMAARRRLSEGGLDRSAERFVAALRPEWEPVG